MLDLIDIGVLDAPFAALALFVLIEPTSLLTLLRIFVLTEAPGFQGGSSLGWTSCLSCGTSLLHRGCIGAGTGWSFRR